MMSSKSGISYWQAKLLYKNLANKLMYEERFFDKHRFLSEMEKHFDSYIRSIGKGNMLYRARILDIQIRKNYKREDGFRGLNKKDSFVPPKKSAKENRASPAGIVYLYVAESAHTAIAEVRPNMLDRVNVAQIEVLQDLSILDLSFNYPTEPVLPYKGSHTLSVLAKEYMIPLDTKDSNSGYLPIQFITEFIRKHTKGFDGIRYNSSLNQTGKNLVIFNYKPELFTITGKTAINPTQNGNIHKM